jgi:DNA repair protein RadA/Sms
VAGGVDRTRLAQVLAVLSRHAGVRVGDQDVFVSVAGGAALTMASNPATKGSTSIAGAVAIQSSDDDTTARIQNSTLTNVADETGALMVVALKGGERTAVATGISANMSTTTTSDLSIVGSVSITHVTDDTAASIDSSTVTGKVANALALAPCVAVN